MSAAPPQNEDDWSLLRAARGGDHPAWEQLWRRHRDRLYRVALAVGRDREDARDAVQAVLLRAVTAAAPPREESLARYLSTAVWREARRLRERSLRQDELDPERTGAPMEQELEDRERERGAREALAALPAAQRDTLALRLVGGLSYEEVARVLGVPVGTVRSRLHAGVRACREHLRRKGRLT